MNMFSCFQLPELSPSHSSGQRAEQARDDPAAHTEPIRNLSEYQQERQHHPTRALCGFMSGELLATPAE